MNKLLDTRRGIVGAAHVLTHNDPDAASSTHLQAWEQDRRKPSEGREPPGARRVSLDHPGDGHLHWNVQAPEGGDGVAFLRDMEPCVNALVLDRLQHFSGSISAEYGIGCLKTKVLSRDKDPLALGMMLAVNRALDPQGVPNPGPVLLP